jgi:hypothetical protein
MLTFSTAFYTTYNIHFIQLSIIHVQNVLSSDMTLNVIGRRNWEWYSKHISSHSGSILFQAAKNSKPILLPIILMNSNRLLVETDTATTVNELCSQISQRIGLRDRSGFSVYITLGHKVRHLGSLKSMIIKAK